MVLCDADVPSDEITVFIFEVGEIIHCERVIGIHLSRRFGHGR